VVPHRSPAAAAGIRFETLDPADLNRIVTAVNRNSVLNSRAALAAAISAVCLALRFMLDLIAN
jgi:hypothetical protein